jgi:hypothetical protein
MTGCPSFLNAPYSKENSTPNTLTFNLLDMTEGGKAGAAVTVLANGAYTLAGFSGSALSSLNVTVNSFADLVKMIRSGYSGRLVDVLVVKVA